MYWDPFEEINRMHEEMDKIFSKYFWDAPAHRPLIGHKGSDIVPTRGTRTPRCNLQETESQMIATFELPGVNKGDIELIVDDDHIELKVESKQEKKNKKKDSYSYMSQSTSFQRYISLPKEVDSNKAKAEYKNGVLRVEVPKKHKTKSKEKRIDIK